MNTFWGMEILLIFFGGHHKIGLYLGFISMHFTLFSLGQGIERGEGDNYWVDKISIVLVCSKFLIFLW